MTIMPTHSRYSTLHGTANTAEIRTATFDGVTHIVVPVIAMVGNSVVRPMNSTGPEFVPAEELSIAPAGWNGRPVVPDHPNNGTSSANDPAILESYSFGRIFNSKYEDGRLKVEAWLDPGRAERVGSSAIEVVNKCRNREMVEISIGAWITAEQRTGTHDGQPYEFVWHGIVPDHLAMGLNGAQGACSIEMGCGGPRANKSQESNPMSDAKPEPVESSAVSKFKNRVLTALGIRTAELSDYELRRKLHSALYAKEPAFDGVVEVFPETSTVIYVTRPDGSSLWWRCTYVQGSDDAITINDDSEMVEEVIEYRAVAAVNGDNNPATLSANCDCHNRKGDINMSVSSKAKEVADRLIAGKAPFEEVDRDYLEGLSEDRLSALESGYVEVKPAVPVPVEATETTPVVTEEAPLTDEEWLAKAPQSLRSMMARHQAQDAAERKALIASLAKAQEVFNEAALTAKSTDELTQLAQLVGLNRARNYEGKVVAGGDESDIYTNPPDGYGIAALQASRKGAGAASNKSN